MKKLLAVLGVSMAVLLGLIAYAAVGLKNEAPETKKVRVEAEVTPIAEVEAVTESKPAVTAAAKAAQTPVEDLLIEEEEAQWDESLDTEQADEIPALNADVVAHDELSYAYSTLSDTERQLYDEIFAGIVNLMENVPVSTTDPMQLDKVFNCVLMDHPEIFYVNGYRYTKYTSKDVIKRIVFSASYVYDRQEIASIAADIDTVAQGIIMNVSPDASDYDKIKYIYDTIVRQTEYDTEAPDNQNVISVLLNKRSVCQGYAKTMQLLLLKLKIPCSLVTGTVGEDRRHAWNVVKADGAWYYTDVTWGDASYILEEGSSGELIVPDVNYDYLMVPYAEIAATHRAEPVTTLPDCVSMDDNYYVREGLYFTDYNTDQLRAAFDRAQALGENYIMLKCSSDDVYARMYAELVDGQHIFDYVNGSDVSYSSNDEMRKLLFALKR